MRVLIAEDDATTREVLASALSSWGYEVVAARDGEEAWAMLQAGETAPLWIVDRMMPRMDGARLCASVRAFERDGATPGTSGLPSRRHYIIFLTVRGSRDDVAAGFAAGADDYITKPFEREELELRVRLGRRVVVLENALEGRAAG